MTIGEKLDFYKGRGPGFDNIRVSLALFILIFHSIILIHDNNDAIYQGPFRGFVVFLLPAFFALSGFLVAGSIFRTGKISTFVTFRALRILPALAVEITLSAIILGPLVTTLPLAEYFKDSEFYLYFTNIVGMVRYELPGVFKDTGGIVNVSLWTIPVEIYCYIFLVILMVTRIVNHKYLLIPTLLGMTAFVVVYDYFRSSVNPILPFPTRILMLYFLCGIMVYKYRYVIAYKNWYPPLSLLIGILLMYRMDTVYLSPMFIAYGIAGLGLMYLPKYPLMDKGDYSYGIYLYAWPIQKTILYYWPTLDNAFIHAVLSVFFTTIFAALSWHLIEKPALKLKDRFRVKTVPLAGSEQEKQISALHEGEKDGNEIQSKIRP